MIPYGRQDITEDDIKAVTDVLRSNYLTTGPKIAEFEEAFASYCGVKYALAVSSCTAALHLSYLALGLKKSDLIWTVPNTFVATANAALYCGADVDFVDIDPKTWNMGADALEDKLLTAHRVPDIVVPVHFAGQSCDMKAIKALSEKYGFKIVEDAAHCTGAEYDGQKIGSCAYSDLACFSLHPVKIMTSGEGGLITTNSEELYQKILRLRSHGVTRDEAFMQGPSDGPWYFQQIDLGYHCRITDFQAALGLSQLSRLDDYVVRRAELIERYNEKLQHLDITLPSVIEDAQPSWHLYVVLLKEAAQRAEIFEKMRTAGIGVNVHYIPVHTQPYYKNIENRDGDYPVSEDYYARALTLPLYPGLIEDEQDYICETLGQVLLA